jgi:GLPGLI family protein
MNRIFSIFILIVFQISFGQKIDVLEYQFDLMGLKDVKSFSVYDGTQTFFFFSQNKNMTFEYLDEEENNINPYYIFNYKNNEKSFYQTFSLSKEDGIQGFTNIKDIVPKINWKTYNETRKILNYTCTLATTKFRGRNYKVWFTTEIPAELFPWKLNGLPGGILAFEEENGFFSGEATRYIRNSSSLLPKALFRNINDSSIQSAIQYKQFIEKDDKYLQDLQNKRISNMPNGANYKLVSIRSGRLETNFEWETEPAKP